MRERNDTDATVNSVNNSHADISTPLMNNAGLHAPCAKFVSIWYFVFPCPFDPLYFLFIYLFVCEFIYSILM